MSTTTPRIGLKSPEGTDPFLTQDFIDNWSTIDTAVGDLQDVLSGGIDADSLNGHPDTYFYSADNPPPATRDTRDTSCPLRCAPASRARSMARRSPAVTPAPASLLWVAARALPGTASRCSATPT